MVKGWKCAQGVKGKGSWEIGLGIVMTLGRNNERLNCSTWSLNFSEILRTFVMPRFCPTETLIYRESMLRCELRSNFVFIEWLVINILSLYTPPSFNRHLLVELVPIQGSIINTFCVPFRNRAVLCKQHWTSLKHLNLLNISTGFRHIVAKGSKSGQQIEGNSPYPSSANFCR